MAVINKTGITNGGTVQAEHITRAIDALSSVGTDTIIATGSLLATSIISSGSINLSKSIVTATASSSIDLTLLGTAPGQRGFRIPLAAPTDPQTGAMYFDGTSLQIFDGVDWQAFVPG
jgi:hypothetical protein